MPTNTPLQAYWMSRAHAVVKDPHNRIPCQVPPTRCLSWEGVKAANHHRWSWNVVCDLQQKASILISWGYRYQSGNKTCSFSHLEEWHESEHCFHHQYSIADLAILQSNPAIHCRMDHIFWRFRFPSAYSLSGNIDNTMLPSGHLLTPKRSITENPQHLKQIHSKLKSHQHICQKWIWDNGSDSSNQHASLKPEYRWELTMRNTPVCGIAIPATSDVIQQPLTGNDLSTDEMLPFFVLRL